MNILATFLIVAIARDMLPQGGSGSKEDAWTLQEIWGEKEEMDRN